MERHFDQDLGKFHNNLLQMAALAERSIGNAIEALKRQDKEMAQKNIDADAEIDEMENELQEQGVDLLACYQPMAIDLRYITTGMSIAVELERIADLAVNISYKAIDVADAPLVKPLIDIPRLAELAQKMVKQSIDCFVNRDDKLAKEVILSDEASDNLRNAIVIELIQEVLFRDGTTAPRAVPLILVARDLERICDHACAIAEDVVYMIRAVMVKHHQERLDKGSQEE